MFNLNKVVAYDKCLEQQAKIRVERKFVFVLIHTPYGLRFFEKVAKNRIAKFYAKCNIYLMPVITALAIFLIVTSLILTFSNSGVRESARDIGPTSNLLIPGINPYLPLSYGWIALVITVIIHEAGHGIVARAYNIKVESTGILLLGIIPIGAFVNIDRDELEKTSNKIKSAILTAGPLNNMIFALISLFALFFVVNSLHPLHMVGPVPLGVKVLSVNPSSIAESVGLTKDSVIENVAGQKIQNIQNLSSVLRSNLGNKVGITWQDKSGQKLLRTISLPPVAENKRGILGVSIRDVNPDPSLVLSNYKNLFWTNPIALILPPTIEQGVVPYSDMMAPRYGSEMLGSSFSIFANFFFWLWFINFNLGIFNALPIGPMDGGQLYNYLIQSKTKTKRVINASLVITIVMTIIVAMSVFLPYVLR